MTLREPFPLENIGAVYNARDYRALLKRLLDDRPGIFNPGDLAVTQQAVPAMGITVAAGGGMVDAAGPGIDGLYLVDNDAPVNVALAAADAVNARRDIIGVRVRDSESAGADNDGAIVAITGVPAAVPVDPALPANFLPLARVAVAALAGTIVNANITDLRRTTAGQGGLVTARGGTIVCTSTTRPTTNLYEGVAIYETDTDRTYIYSGAVWNYQRGGTDPVSVRAYRDAALNTPGAAAFAIVVFNQESWDYGNNYNPGTGRYTAPITADLLVTARLSVAAQAADRFQGAVFINGAEAARGTDVPSTGAARYEVGVNTVVHVAAGDLLDFRIAQPAGVARATDVGGSGELFYLTISRA